MKSTRSRLVHWAVTSVLLGGLSAGCGSDSDSDSDTDDSGRAPSPTAATAAGLGSVEEWCATARETLPRFANPTPDDRAIEAIDVHIARATALAGGAPGVPASATSTMADVAALLTTVRRRVADGEDVSEVLKDVYPTEMLELGTVADQEITAVCGERP